MKKIYVLVLVGILISTVSCTKEENILQPQVTNDAPVAYKNNMLVFANAETMQEVLAGKIDLPFSTSFVSQKDLFNQISEEEYNYACSLKDLSDEEYEKCQRHCDLYLKALNDKFIKEQIYEDNSVLYDLNIVSTIYGKILNEKGFYAIKDTIYQVTANEIRAWENCKTLEEVNNTPYKVIYAEEPTTKSLFPLNSIDQTIAYYSNSYAYPNDRAIASFYDKTRLALPNVERDLFVRVSLQRKADGRNYTYYPSPYSLIVGTTVSRNGELTYPWFNAQGTSANDWYTLFLEYGLISSGKTTQTYTETYCYLAGFHIELTYTVQHPEAVSVYEREDKITVYLIADREAPTSGIFHYQTRGGARPLSSLLPDE